jgi:4-methyl-5(b-hydroxyethyl)-thiazole monophosphate biosynthesis
MGLMLCPSRRLQGAPVPNCLVVLAPGAEEIEYMTVCDVLVRAGAQVITASAVGAPVVTGSRGIPLAAHSLLDLHLATAFDCVYLPGGVKSAEHHRDDARTQELAATQLASGRLLALICAAPIALVPRKLCAGRRLTSHPGSRAVVEPAAAAWLDRPVVEDGNLITSQAAGTTLALALTLARRLAGPEVAARVARDMLVPDAVAAHAAS